ncbi:MAG: hypothetical protein U1F34_01275 [Gammaproteobacteria bacterium]
MSQIGQDLGIDRMADVPGDFPSFSISSACLPQALYTDYAHNHHQRNDNYDYIHDRIALRHAEDSGFNHQRRDNDKRRHN